MTDLAGKIALVLGAGGRDNMGQAIASKFAAAGAKVVVAGRNVDELQRFAKTIDADWTSCDITRKADIDAMLSYVIEQHAHLDIAVNSTGWGLLVPLTETTEEQLEQMIALQFKGPFQWLQGVVGAMDRGGSIIQISSATATIMLENHAAYMGTKAGIDHVVRCVANEYGARGIRANSISPGLTDSPMTAEAMQSAALVETFRQCYPLGRIGTREDIAKAALFLASDDCFMTGENLQVNGGLCLRRNPSNDELAAAMRG